MDYSIICDYVHASEDYQRLLDQVVADGGMVTLERMTYNLGKAKQVHLLILHGSHGIEPSKGGVTAPAEPLGVIAQAHLVTEPTGASERDEIYAYMEKVIWGYLSVSMPPANLMYI